MDDGLSYKDHEVGENTGIKTEGDQEESTERIEQVPAISDILRDGAPPEYIPILVISFILCIIVICLFVRAVDQHRKHFTKNTLQGLCTLGIILTFPVYTVMYYSGIIVPKAMAKVTFIAETYEAISLVFFLRLLFTYLGGKKETVGKLKGSHVALANPPICCLVCLPHIRFGRCYMRVHEIFILQLFVCQLVLGYIDLLIGIDNSHGHPASLVEEKYSHYFHGFILFSLLLAIYGLGGIYHAAEEQLKRYHIFTKFILYKAFVTVAKLEELVVAFTVSKLDAKYKVNLKQGAIPGELRIHMWCYFLVVVEASILFPFLLNAYSVKDYPGVVHRTSKDIEDAAPMNDEAVEEKSDCVMFPAVENKNGGTDKTEL